MTFARADEWISTKLRDWKESVVRQADRRPGPAAQAAARLSSSRAARGSPDAHDADRGRRDGRSRPSTFEQAILATGSRPAAIPGLPSSPRIWDSTGALTLESVPKTLLVVGGGYIGLELGSVYAALGSRVTVVEMLPGLLPGADRDLVMPAGPAPGKAIRRHPPRTPRSRR